MVVVVVVVVASSPPPPKFSCASNALKHVLYGESCTEATKKGGIGCKKWHVDVMRSCFRPPNSCEYGTVSFFLNFTCGRLNPRKSIPRSNVWRQRFPLPLPCVRRECTCNVPWGHAPTIYLPPRWYDRSKAVCPRKIFPIKLRQTTKRQTRMWSGHISHFLEPSNGPVTCVIRQSDIEINLPYRYGKH